MQIEDVYSAIQAQFGSLTASQFNQFSRVWWVILQSDARYRQDPGDLTRLYTRSKDGKMVPLSALVTTKWVAGSRPAAALQRLPRGEDQRQPGAGIQLGRRDRRDGGDGEGGAAARATRSRGRASRSRRRNPAARRRIAFVFGLIIVFLVLAAQYESWTLPGAVMSAVPFGILGALVTNWLRGLDNDVYFQIGLLVLIGLGAKNAVLRVSAAVEFRHQGKSIMEATVLAGEQRLRPIIMTSLAFAVGCLPLALALGAGANARHSIGTGIIGGMLGETTLAMLYVPLLFYLFDQLDERQARAGRRRRRMPRRPTPQPAPAGRAARRAAARAAGGRVMRVRARRNGLTRDAACARARSPIGSPARGCSWPAARSGPTTSRPKVDAPAAFRFEPAKVAETANTAWWKQFGDPVLDQLIDTALANNLNVKIAAANVEQAAGGDHADALAAVPADRLRRHRRARRASRTRASSP